MSEEKNDVTAISNTVTYSVLSNRTLYNGHKVKRTLMNVGRFKTHMDARVTAFERAMTKYNRSIFTVLETVLKIEAIR